MGKERDGIKGCRERRDERRNKLGERKQIRKKEFKEKRKKTVKVEYSRLYGYISLQRTFLTFDMGDKYLLQFKGCVLCSICLSCCKCV
jgi:hypothetical protein